MPETTEPTTTARTWRLLDTAVALLASAPLDPDQPTADAVNAAGEALKVLGHVQPDAMAELADLLAAGERAKYPLRVAHAGPPELAGAGRAEAQVTVPLAVWNRSGRDVDAPVPVYDQAELAGRLQLAITSALDGHYYVADQEPTSEQVAAIATTAVLSVLAGL